MRSVRHYLYVAFLFSVFVNVLMLTGPLFMLQVYDRVLGSRSEETLAALVILVLGLYILMWMLDFARNRLLARYGAQFQLAFDAQVFRAQFGKDPRALSARTASRDLEAVQSFCGSPALPAMMDLPFSLTFVGVIFVFHPFLGWVALVGCLILIAIPAVSQVLTTRQVTKAHRAAEAAHRFADSARAAQEVVQGLGMLRQVTERFMELRRSALSRSMATVDWTGAFTSFTRAIRLSLQSLVLAVGAWLVLQGEITAGAMIAASILLGRAFAPIEQVIGRWSQFVGALQARIRLQNFISADEAPDTRTRLPRPLGRLDVKGLTLATGAGRPPILYNVTFRVLPGEALGVIGPSGSGKSTIAKAIVGIVSASIGEVRLGGALISQYRSEDLGSFVGYLPQEPMLLPGTIAENIARMESPPDSDLVLAAAQRATAHELILSLPDGYETRIEDGKIGLSAGQRQRIALARALYGDPVLLVLDEPNSALDQEGSEALNAAIRKLKAEGRAVIVMTHRPVAISECDRMMVVEDGQVKAIGSQEAIIKSMLKNASDVQRTIAGRGL